MKTSFFKRTRLLTLALAAGAAALLPTARAQTTLYGVSFFDNQLFSVNPTTGAGTLIGTGLGTNAFGYGLGFRGSQLYTFNSVTDRIQEISTTTGLVTSSINIGVGNLTGEGDLTFRSDGVGFLSTVFKNGSSTPTNDLYSFNVATNSSSLLGSTSVALDGLAFIGNTLYGVSQDARPSLYSVNQTTAALTLIGSLGVDMNSPFLGLSARAGGGLFASVDDRLYTINAATGAATEVNPNPFVDIGFSSVSGLAQASPVTPPIGAVPEPSTYGLMAAASLLVGVTIRRRFAKKAR